MGMDTSVVGFKPPDAKWKKMKAVWDATTEAGIELPPAVEKYFNDEEPDEAGVRIELTYPKLHKAVKAYNVEGSAGFEIHLDELPEDVKIIRFMNSW